ncbi:hypothetical protein BH23BAC2_BH23BAC2_21940 [soil metagenome]
MRKFRNLICLLILSILLNSCSKGDVEIIEDPNNNFSANIAGKQFVLSQQEICAFPNPCRTNGGIEMVYLNLNQLELRAGDVKNKHAFKVKLLVNDLNNFIEIVESNFLYGTDLDESLNFISIIYINENIVKAYTEFDGFINYSDVTLKYDLVEGEINILEFDKENFLFEVEFAGRFKWRKEGVRQGENFYPYTYPSGIPEFINISNGYFQITER